MGKVNEVHLHVMVQTGGTCCVVCICSTHLLGVKSWTLKRRCCLLIKKRKRKKLRRGDTPQAWMKDMEMELSDSDVLTLPGEFEPATPKSLA